MCITVAVDNTFQEYLFINEFSHHFADSSDEYYTLQLMKCKMGAFEEAQCKSTGLYRSAQIVSCLPRHDKFCPACQRAIKLIIDQCSN